MIKKNEAKALFSNGQITEAALAALEAGEGTRAYGAGNGIIPNDEYTLQAINFRSERMRPETTNDDGTDKYPSEVWFTMSEEEQAIAQPRLTKWFEFETNNGPLSFGAVLGHKNLNTADFWEDGEVEKSDDFDPTKVFMPSARTPEAWMRNKCDELLGKTLRCVAVKTDGSGARSRKYRAFVIVGSKKKEEK